MQVNPHACPSINSRVVVGEGAKVDFRFRLRTPHLHLCEIQCGIQFWSIEGRLYVRRQGSYPCRTPDGKVNSYLP